MRTLHTLVAACALALAGCAARPVDLMTVQTAVVKPGRLVEHVEVSGVLAPRQTAIVSSRLSGQAGSVAVDVGSAVRRGEVLVEIDTGELTARLAVAEAAVEMVQDQARQARLGIETSKANLDLAQKSYDRAAALITSQSITQGQMDDAQARLQVARAAYQNAQEQYRLLASASLDQARAQANLIRVQISHGTVTSPIAGIVTNRNVNPGEVVSPNSPLLTVVDASALKLQGNVAQSIATLLSPGTPVQVRVDGMRQGDYQGFVTQVGPVAAPTGQFFPVIISVKNDGRLMAGMTALAAFEIPGRQALLVPRSAVAMVNGRACVFVLSGGRVERRPVTLGLENASAAEVLQGLAASEKVAASNVDALQDGMPVRGR